MKIKPSETIEIQERMIKKLQRDITQLERTITILQDELLNYKKEQKIRLLEIQKRVKDQSRTIQELKSRTKQETRTLEEMSLEHIEKEETALSKIKGLEEKNELMQIESEELINKITQNNVSILEKDEIIANLNSQINELKNKIEYIKQNELNELQQKIMVKEELLNQQNDAVNKLTLEIKKDEVEIAELEYKLSNEQSKHKDLEELLKKVEKQDDIIIHLRKINITNEEKAEQLRAQLNIANKRIDDLLQTIKALEERPAQSEVKIPYFQIKLPE
ncbi:MAG TPA: hypothetical protein VMV49_06965 [Candidatus Deferrimicrobium sp.]|nr:hypothetical protein [Candidatus Deferrimicrobium sp.]